MFKEKGTIENGKMLTGHTNAGREIWKTIPKPIEKRVFS